MNSKEKVKIALIIPVYNVESYLKRAIDSALNQSLKEILLICIDDCSTDSSYSLLLSYSSKDPRIIPLHNEKNLGCGATRNKGLDYIFSLKNPPEFVLFLDSDDRYSDPKAFELLYKEAQEKKADIVDYGYKVVANEDESKYHFELTPQPEIFEGNCLLRYKKFDWHFTPLYSGMFRSIILKNIRFTNHSWNEDIFFRYKAVASAKKLVVFPGCFYVYYYGRKNSQMMKINEKIQKGEKVVDDKQLFDIVGFLKEKGFLEKLEIKCLIVELILFIFRIRRSVVDVPGIRFLNDLFGFDISEEKYMKLFSEDTKAVIEKAKLKKD